MDLVQPPLGADPLKHEEVKAVGGAPDRVDAEHSPRSPPPAEGDYFKYYKIQLIF